MIVMVRIMMTSLYLGVIAGKDYGGGVHSVLGIGTQVWKKKTLIFGCEDAAQQVLMSVCLSVCLSVDNLKFFFIPRFQNVLECSRIFQNVPEYSRKFQNVAESSRMLQNVTECWQLLNHSHETTM